MITLQPIGIVRSPYTDTAAIPKGQGARHDAEGVLEIRPELEAGLADIEGFSHLIVVWIFDRSRGAELVAHPPSDDRPHGVFATRSPQRPNPIGLTVVRLLRRDGPRLHVQGIDMLDGTPIVDIKPYLSSVPADEIRRGWLDEAESRRARDSHDLDRFVQAQSRDYARALSEIKSGRKRSHWMWYIFPQFEGLGASSMSRLYAIKNVAEAEAFLRHPLLGPRLTECAEAVLSIESRSAREIFGSPDDLKLKSCATLFAFASPAESVFHRVLDQYFQRQHDRRTLQLLGSERRH